MSLTTFLLDRPGFRHNVEQMMRGAETRMLPAPVTRLVGNQTYVVGADPASTLNPHTCGECLVASYLRAIDGTQAETIDDIALQGARVSIVDDCDQLRHSSGLQTCMLCGRMSANAHPDAEVCP